MRPGRASFTAQVVAFARGLATLSSPTDTRVEDRLARALLPAHFAWVLGAAAHTPRGSRALRRGLDGVTGNLVEHMALRTLAIDDAVRESVALGARQLVLLGAGLDARAYRLDALRGAVVFEVDHPDTQREKRRRIGGHIPLAQHVRYVPVDFSRDSLEQALAGAGHDARVPTCWVWEGVTMYLSQPAMRASLQALSARSAAGSRLAVTYMDRRSFDGLPGASSLTHVFFRALGEPLRGRYTPDELGGVLAEASFRVCADTASADWRRAYGARTPLLRVFDSERLAVAERV
jgi:methyltransferase (TIGR00027 family)